MNKRTFILILIIITSVVIFVSIVSLSEMVNDFICDVGENNTMGDYKVLPATSFNQRGCAIKDCDSFNDYWKENCKGMECPICAV